MVSGDYHLPLTPKMKIKLFFFVITNFLVLACGTIATLAPTPTALPTALPPTQVAPTATRVATPVGSVPTCWDAQIAMPPGAEFAGLVRGAVTWHTRDLNADGLRDWFVRATTNAGYAPTTIVKSRGAIYDVLFVKGQTAFALNITVGRDATILTGTRVGVLHLQVSGEANLERDLPMRNPVDITPGSEISIGTSIPNSQCAECEFFININIAPFKGAGTYDSKPGVAIIDLQVIPGGKLVEDDYRWAQSCIVVVKDARGGTFDCRGLQNVLNQARKIDVRGWWTQP